MPMNRGITKADEEKTKTRMVVNRYKVVKKLGSGNYGTAFLVEDLKTDDDDKMRVMKEIPVGDLQPDETVGAIQEARLLSKLEHPNIVKFYDSFMDGTFFCIITEHCEGGDLDNRLTTSKKKGKRLDEGLVMEWLIQLTMGVQYMHSRRVLHRDLKARNIFLKSNIIKIGDFGISRILSATTDLANTFTGTPYYMSPEVLQHDGYNSKSDVWSIGCLLFELCSLQHAFDGQSLMGVMYKIVEGQCPTLKGDYSADLQDILEKILIKDSKKRPTARDIMQFPYVQRHLKMLRTTICLNKGIDPSETVIKNEAAEISNLLSQAAHLKDIQEDTLKVLTPKEQMELRKQMKAEQRAAELKSAGGDYVVNKVQAKIRKEQTLLSSDALPYKAEDIRPSLQLGAENNYDANYINIHARSRSPDPDHTLTTSSPSGGALRTASPRSQLSRSLAAGQRDFHSELYRSSGGGSGGGTAGLAGAEENNGGGRLHRTTNIYDVKYSDLHTEPGSHALLCRVLPTLGPENVNPNDAVDPSADEANGSYTGEGDDGNGDTNATQKDTMSEMLSCMESALRNSGDTDGSPLSDGSKTDFFGPASRDLKIKNLKTECTRIMGQDQFDRVYEYLNKKRFVSKKVEAESKIMSGLKDLCDNVSDCFLVDQLLFLEHSKI